MYRKLLIFHVHPTIGQPYLLVTLVIASAIFVLKKMLHYTFYNLSFDALITVRYWLLFIRYMRNGNSIAAFKFSYLINIFFSLFYYVMLRKKIKVA